MLDVSASRVVDFPPPSVVEIRVPDARFVVCAGPTNQKPIRSKKVIQIVTKAKTKSTVSKSLILTAFGLGHDLYYFY